MKEKIARAKIVSSTVHWDQVSIRGLGDEGIREVLTRAGFKEGDRVVIVLANDEETVELKADAER